MKTDQSNATEGSEITRRPLESRNTKWAAATARWLGNAGLRPNHISLLSMVFGAAAAACLLGAGRVDSFAIRVLLLLLTAACIQLRLLCNLFDGMVAVEGGFKTKSGEVFNELPDRFSDVVIFLAAGYSGANLAWLPELGWSAALLSVLTAYVRAFGGAAGATQQFCGPMAKQQRMAVITGSALLAAMLAGTPHWAEVIRLALGLVIAGCAVTVVRRIARVIAELEAK